MKFIRQYFTKCNVDEYYMNLIKSRTLTLQEVPYGYRNYQICKLALNHDKKSFKYIPKEILDDSLREIASKFIKK